MLSLEQIVRNPENFRTALVRRGEDPPIDKIVDLDSQRKELIHLADIDRANRNRVSKAIGDERRKPTTEEISEMRAAGERIKRLESELSAVVDE